MYRAELGRGVVLGDDDDERGHDQAHDAAEIERLTREADVPDLHGGVHAHEPGGERPEQDQRQNAGHDDALVQRPHDRLARAEADEKRADDRCDDACRADRERIEHHLHDALLAAREIDGGEHHGGDDGHDIGLEQIGSHAGAVADIVAHIVGDGRGVARIILGDAGLDLADEIAADVGALGEDAAAKPGEDGDERGAEAESDQRVDHLARRGRIAKGFGEYEEIDGDAEKRETGDEEAGDGARAEGEAQAIGEALGGGLCRAHIGAHRHVHADIAGRARQDGADRETDRLGEPEQEEQRDEDNHAHKADRLVLAREIGLRALLDGGGNLLHARASRVRREDSPGGPDAVRDG